MSLNESVVQDPALEWFRLRRGYGGQVGDPRSPRLRWTGLGYAFGHGAAFAQLRRAKPSLAPGEPAAASACASRADRRDSFRELVHFRCARTLTLPLPAGAESGRLHGAIRRLNPGITFHTLDVPRGTLPPKLLGGELSVREMNAEHEAAV